MCFTQSIYIHREAAGKTGEREIREVEQEHAGRGIPRVRGYAPCPKKGEAHMV